MVPGNVLTYSGSGGDRSVAQIRVEGTMVGTGRRRARAVTVTLALVAGLVAGWSADSGAVSGNIAGAIEIDSPSANLHLGGSSVACTSVGATLPAGTDWVKD